MKLCFYFLHFFVFFIFKRLAPFRRPLLIPSGVIWKDRKVPSAQGNFLVSLENRGAPYRSRAPGHLRSSRCSLRYCGVLEKNFWKVPSRGGNFLVRLENRGAPHRSRAPDHPRSSRFNLTYCGVPENKSGIFLGPLAAPFQRSWASKKVQKNFTLFENSYFSSVSGLETLSIVFAVSKTYPPMP